MFCEAFETGRLIGFHTKNKIKMRPMYSCFPAYIHVFGKNYKMAPIQLISYGVNVFPLC